LFNLSGVDEAKKIIGGDRTFIAFFKDCSYSVTLDQEVDDLRDVLLGLQRVVCILKVNDCFP
jgi:hypothetical protein